MNKSLISTSKEHKNYKNIYKSLPIKIQKLKMNFRSRLERECKMFDNYSTKKTN